MKPIFEELKRRNVIRVGAAYLVAAWVLLQIGDVLFEFLDVPESAGKLLVAILALGFPLTLIFAWAFELTPEGLKTDAEVDHSQAASNFTAKKLDIITIIMVVAALGLFVADRFLIPSNSPTKTGQSAGVIASDAAGVTTSPTSGVSVPIDASVAVLPFDNISLDAANEPFTIGIHDDLLTQISKLGSLRTISRTSVLRYKDRTRPVPEIAAELGVATVLEGSVQRAGDQVRINVQLIDAASNTQMWAEQYQRDLTAANIFAIQSDIVKTIADSLQTTLSPAEQKSIDTAPTQNLVALEAYFLGRQRLAERNTRSLEEAVEHFEQAITLDPNFALAYVGLSDSLQLLEDVGSLPRDEMFAKAEPAIIKALSLDPRLGAAYTSYGGLRVIQGDIVAGEALYKRGIELSPNHVTTYLWYGFLLLDVGRVDEAARLIEQGVEHDPLSSQMNETLGYVLESQGRFDAALRQYRKLLDLHPNFASSYLAIGNIFWMALARPDRGIACQRKSIDLDPGSRLALSWHGLLFLDLGDLSEAERWIRASLQRGPESQEPRVALALLAARKGQQADSAEYAAEVYTIVPWHQNARLFQSMALAILRNRDLRAGKLENARSLYAATYPALLGDVAPEINSENFRPAIDLAVILKQSGDTDRASLLLDRSLAFVKSGTVARLGSGGYGIADVQIHALRGETRQAVASLRQAIDQGWLGFWWFYLKNNPNLESLSGNAEFQAMVQEIEAFTETQLSQLSATDTCDGI